MNRTFVSKIKAGQNISGYYILNNAAIKLTRKGTQYLTATLADRTGSIPLKVWNYYDDIVNENDNGKAVYVSGTSDENTGTLQLVAQLIRPVNENDRGKYSADDLVPIAPIDVATTTQEVKKLIQSIADMDYRAICEQMIKQYGKDFSNIPAAKSIHHAALHGLLMHTANMMELADKVSSMYSDCINRSLLLAGTFLHDFGKIEEFMFSEFGLVTDYSMKGQLMGHLAIGAMRVGEVGKKLNVSEEKVVLLQHLLLSHHGQPDYGAVKRPACAEAEALAWIDMLDAKLQVYRETLENMEVGTFSGNIFGLDGVKVYKHMDTTAKGEKTV